MTPDSLANKMNRLKDEAAPIYIPLAKFALWLTAVVLVLLVVRGAWLVYVDGCRGFTHEEVGNVIAAAQVLAFITLAVLGYRGGKGMLK